MFNNLKNKIHILQNVYIKNRYFLKRETFAMDGEDIAIKRYAEKIKNGIYVDLSNKIQTFSTPVLRFKKDYDT